MENGRKGGKVVVGGEEETNGGETPGDDDDDRGEKTVDSQLNTPPHHDTPREYQARRGISRLGLCYTCVDLS